MIVENLPVSSALARSHSPDAVLETPEVQLLAYAADMSALNFWAKTEDAAKKPPQNRPKPAIEMLTRHAPASEAGGLSDPNVVAAMDEFFSLPRVAA